MKKINIGIIFISILLLFFSQSLCLNAELKKAANFILRDPWNNKFSLRQFKGKTVILNFFRIYCGGRIRPETEKQIQELNKVCREFCKSKNCTGGSLVVLSIALATCSTTDLKDWVKKHNINWFLGNDYDDYNLDIIKSYAEHLSKLKDPALIFINPFQGIVSASNYLDASEIMKKLKKISSVSKKK